MIRALATLVASTTVLSIVCGPTAAADRPDQGVADEPESGPGVDPDRDPTNFSYVDWGAVAAALHLKVNTDPGNDPRLG